MDFVFVVSSVRVKKPNCMFKCLQFYFNSAANICLKRQQQMNYELPFYIVTLCFYSERNGMELQQSWLLPLFS